jgi:hypothetical protein
VSNLRESTLALAFYGNAVPDFDCTNEISELLIAPLTVTSFRKLLENQKMPSNWTPLDGVIEGYRRSAGNCDSSTDKVGMVCFHG